MLVKVFFIRVAREVREGSFQIVTTLVLCFSMAFFIVILGMFINDRVKRIRLYEDAYIPQANTYSNNLHNCPLQTSHLISRPPTSNVTNHSIKCNTTETLWHSMSDDELMWRASMVPRIPYYPYNRTPRVAFLFLTRGRLPLAPLWERFFKGHEGLFSIYLHTSPEFTHEPPQSSIFYNRRIPSKQVQWGKSTMIDAERRLIANALLDFSNERFVLLSESCIPIFNFTTIYNYLINSRQSFLDCFDDPRPIGRGRYNRKMWPLIELSDWRKGNQWFEINRKLAIEIVSDFRYYPIFKSHCVPPCYMDEHYLPTLVTKIGSKLTSNRTITWTDWSGGGSHPRSFRRNDISETFLNRVRYGFNCSYNDVVTSICYLFARKFHPSSLEPLLKTAPALLGFDL